jgi:DNA-binding beta-propeller fold protein YncE
MLKMRSVVRGNVAAQESPAGIRHFASATVLATFGALLWWASPAPAAVTVTPTLVKTIATSSFAQPSPDPSGIAYRPGQDRLLISDSEVDETPLFQGFNLFTSTRGGAGFGSGNLLPSNREPTDLGFNPQTGALYVSDDDRDRVSIIRPGPNGVHGNADDIVSRFSTAAFGSTDPEGVVYDQATGHLFISDGARIRIYRVNPVNGVFGDGNDTVSFLGLGRYGLGDVEGLGIDPRSNRLLAVDPTTDAIYELGKGGAHFRTLRLSAIPTTRSVVADVTLAPTSNPSDSPSTLDYWIVDRHVDNGSQPNENDGLLYEMR